MKTITKNALKRNLSKAKMLMDLEYKYGCHNDTPLPVVLERGQVS